MQVVAKQRKYFLMWKGNQKIIFQMWKDFFNFILLNCIFICFNHMFIVVQISLMRYLNSSGAFKLNDFNHSPSKTVLDRNKSSS